MRSSATVTLFRHGKTEWSVTGRFAGHTDIPLTPEGEHEVERYREQHGVTRYDSVSVSSLQRAIRTADLLGYPEAERLDVLRERDYGAFEGMTTAQIRERVPGWNVWTDEIPQAESIAAFVARVDRVVDCFKNQARGAHLVVAHAHWIRMFTARWLELPPAGAGLFRADTLGKAVLGWERENPVMLAWNR
jgi:broad specificity phosphatase PhoE